MAKTPVAVSLVCCEKMIVEEGTRNITVVNCFSGKEVETVPADPFPFMVFVTLIDGIGEMPLQIRIDRLDTVEEIYRRRRIINLDNTLHELNCGFRIRDCFFPVTGDYELCLLVNKELVANRKIRISLRGNSNE